MPDSRDLAEPLSNRLDSGGVISFGIRELDEKLGGGIHQGSLVLVDGRFDARKSLVAQQFTTRALEQGHHVAFYVTEHDTLSLLEVMEHYGMDVTDHFLLGRLNIYPVSADGHAGAKAFTLLREHFSRLAQFDVVVVDALSMFMADVRDEEFQEFLTACRYHSSGQKTVMLTVHSHILSAMMFEQIRCICNVHLRLRVEQTRFPPKREFSVLEVAIAQDAELTRNNIFSFETEPGHGMNPLPFSTTKG